MQRTKDKKKKCKLKNRKRSTYKKRSRKDIKRSRGGKNELTSLEKKELEQVKKPLQLQKCLLYEKKLEEIDLTERDECVEENKKKTF